MDQIYNIHTNKAADSKTFTGKQLITESNWDLLMRHGHVDNTRSASAQGYKVVDEVKFLFGVYSKSQRKAPASDLVEENEKTDDNIKSQDTTACKQTTSEADTTETEAGPSGTNYNSSGNQRGWKAVWTEEEKEELVTLRCQGLSHPDIANNPKYLPGRDLKAVQQKFAKLVRVPPYKQRWVQFKNWKGKGGKKSNGQKEIEEDGDEEEEDY